MSQEQSAGGSRHPRVFASIGIAVIVAFLLGTLTLLFTVQGQGHELGGNHTAGQTAHRPMNHTGDADHGGSDGSSSLVVIGLVVPSVYLGGLTLWAALRQKWVFLVRHTVSATAMWLLVFLYLNARGAIGQNAHDWNRSFADASVVLYAVTLGIGPLVRLWRPSAVALSWRRETGIWATIAALVHVAIFWETRYGWAGWRNFFDPNDGHGNTTSTLGESSAGFGPTGFAVANVVGLVALGYALVLTITSNDVSQRWLKTGWTWLMKRATTMQLLVLLHTWLFAYYITHENLLALGTLWLSFWAVLLLQTVAFVKGVWFRRRPAPVAPEAARMPGT